MTPRGIERPVPARQAFGREDPAALQSQAATLLLLRAQLRRDAAALAARAGRAGRPPRAEMVPPRDVATLRVPRLRGTRRRIPEAAVRTALATRYGQSVIARRGAPARGGSRRPLGPRPALPAEPDRDRGRPAHPRVPGSSSRAPTGRRRRNALRAVEHGRAGAHDPRARRRQPGPARAGGRGDGPGADRPGRPAAPGAPREPADVRARPRHHTRAFWFTARSPGPTRGGSPGATSTSTCAPRSARTSTAPPTASSGRAATPTRPGPLARRTLTPGSAPGGWPASISSPTATAEAWPCWRPRQPLGGRAGAPELSRPRPPVLPGLHARVPGGLDPRAPRPGDPGRRERATVPRPADRGARAADLVRPLRHPRSPRCRRATTCRASSRRPACHGVRYGSPASSSSSLSTPPGA